jgi:hypothetical protein
METMVAILCLMLLAGLWLMTLDKLNKELKK